MKMTVSRDWNTLFDDLDSFLLNYRRAEASINRRIDTESNERGHGPNGLILRTGKVRHSIWKRLPSSKWV